MNTDESSTNRIILIASLFLIRCEQKPLMKKLGLAILSHVLCLKLHPLRTSHCKRSSFGLCSARGGTTSMAAKEAAMVETLVHTTPYKCKL